MIERPIRSALVPLALATMTLLSGCDLEVMNPAGDVARQQAHLILWSTGLMLLIIVPVIVLTVLFAWRYRATNDRNTSDVLLTVMQAAGTGVSSVGGGAGLSTTPLTDIMA